MSLSTEKVPANTSSPPFLLPLSSPRSLLPFKSKGKRYFPCHVPEVCWSTGSKKSKEEREEREEGREGGRLVLVVFADFHDVNTPTVAKFKLPI